MLINVTALGFGPVTKRDYIDGVLERYVTDFTNNLIFIYNEFKTENKHIETERLHNLCSIDNYHYFNNLYVGSKPISFNSKNIIFETNCGLWGPFKSRLDRLRLERQHMLEKIDMQGCYQSDIDTTELYDDDDYNTFFGSGEFPVMVLKVVRIGNIDYSFYTIER